MIDDLSNDGMGVACTACGSPLPDASELVKTLAARERTITALRNELVEEYATHKHADAARRVLWDWNDTVKNGSARKPDSKERMKCVIARLNERYTEYDLALANRGAAENPWRDGEMVYDDATTIFKSAASVDRHISVSPPQLEELWREQWDLDVLRDLTRRLVERRQRDRLTREIMERPLTLELAA